MEHGFYIDLLPLTLPVCHYFLEMSQSGPVYSGEVRNDRTRDKQAIQSQDLDHVM